MSNFDVVKLELEDRVAIVTLNRPEKLNAINLEMKQALDKVLDEIQSNESVKVVIIKGEGRAFCAGGDLRAIQTGEGLGRPEDLRYSQTILKKLINLKQIVISAVHGSAMGAGCNLALSADLVYAAKGTKFGQSFVKVGIVPDWGGMYTLPRLVGIRKAKEWILFGKPFDAEEALARGVINDIFDPEALHSEILQRAIKLSRGPSTAIQMVKNVLDNISQKGIDAVFDAEVDAFIKSKETGDLEEGINAFFEKRDPVFK